MLRPVKQESSNSSMVPRRSCSWMRRVREARLAAPSDWAIRPSCRKSILAPVMMRRTFLSARAVRFLMTAASPKAPDGSEMQRNDSHKTRIARLTSPLVTVSVRVRVWRQTANGRAPACRTAVPSQKISSSGRATGCPAVRAARMDACPTPSTPTNSRSGQ